ncbi:MAG: RNA methyltransferase [Pseudomonadota bacterium]
MPPPAIKITNANDPRIAVFTRLRERDLIGREGLFIAEGASVLRVLLRAPIETVALLVEGGRAARMPWLDARGDAPLYIAEQSVLDTIAGYHLHRGILGAGRIPAGIDVAALPSGPLRLPVLVGLSNHDNVGGVFRNAAAFGAAAVAIDAGTADPFYRKAIRVGVGAPLMVPIIRTEDAANFVGTLRAAGITPYALSPSAPATLGETVFAARAAFLMGTEGPGLPPPLMAAAAPVAIKIAPGFDSLNVAAASAIALHTHVLQHGL